jgi:hypothetical protein
MSRFRKKPVVIEAFQWDGTVASYDAINRWAGQEQTDAANNVWRDRVQQGVGEEYFTALVIHTLEGDMRAKAGDWIIRGVKGEYYPCKPDIFAATYEPVEEQPA